MSHFGGMSSLGKSFAGSEPSYNMIYLTWLEQFASIFPGICFYHSFYSMVWNSDQFNNCIYFWIIWMSSLFQFVDLDGAILNLIRKFANNTKMCNWCFQFSSKNTSISLEPLSRAWHKNWQPTYCQEGARPCWEVKNIHNSKVSSNFPLLNLFFFWT